jgi:hypothetical protein
MEISSLLPHKALYWPPTVNDGFGQTTFAGVQAIEISCRWQDAVKTYRDEQGKEYVSTAVVYTSVALKNGGRLAFTSVAVAGNNASPDQVSASEIRHVGASPSLHAETTLHKAVLV